MERAMETVTITLPEALKKFADDQLAKKGLGDLSEYFLGLLQEAQAKEAAARLEQLLLEGLESGESIPVNDAFWAELRQDAARVAEDHALA
jgi:antitoxin ParD1/3/4